MREVAEWVFNMSMPGDGMPSCRPAEILTAAIDDPDPDRHAAAEAAILHLAAIWNKPDPKIKASVYSTAVTVCDSVARPARHRRHRPRPTTTPASGSTWTG